ncbi:MAG: protein kinase [Myxococcota bacterium]|nr:protein kinase [Myxococcota bacterium]
MSSANRLIGAEVGSYTVVDRLGQGGMATVFEVKHKETGATRALKLIHPGVQDEEAMTRFNAEFQVLSQLSHPNITRVLEAGSWNDQSYFVMEKLQGQDLRSEVKSWKDIPPAERFSRTENILVQLVGALAYIHDRGLIHRDVSPSNIMVAPDGSVKLMDFGVVKAPGREVTAVGEMVGTVAYMAPEQISGDEVDSRADLYSLGTVLYLMLTGKRPFNARTLAGYLEKHLNLPPRPPREVDPFVPARLDNICLRLLEKSPRDRFGSANHLLAILDRHLAGLEHIDLSCWPPRLVGRTSATAHLLEGLSNVSAGRGSALVIEGTAGFGKSRLLADVMERAMERNLPVSSHICIPDKREYGAFQEIVESLEPDRSQLPPALITAFFDGESEVERYAVHAAVRDLLREKGPRVLVLDDLDSADRGSQELLVFLLRNHLELANDPILFVLARCPPSSLDIFADMLSDEDFEFERVRLQHLGITDVEELLAQLIPADDRGRKLAERLQREGEGNPTFIAEMIRGLVEEGIIQITEEDVYELTIPMEELTRIQLPLPTNIREALRERLLPLSKKARAFACMLAICRQEVTLELMIETLGETEDDALDRVEELLNAGVARQRTAGTDELFVLSRPRLRDLLLEEMGPENRAILHRRAGSAMERIFRHRVAMVVDELAWHFEQGQIPAKAYPYLIRAGERLQARSFVPEALECYERALSIEAEAREFLVLDDADRRLADLRLKRGLALYHMGAWTQACEELERSDSLARTLEDARLQCRTACELGNFFRRQHRLDEASTNLSEALLLADRVGDPKLRVGPLHGLASLHWSRGDLDASRRYSLDCLTVAGNIGDDRALGDGYNGLGLVAICRGQSAEARKYLDQAIQIFERLGVISALAVTRINLAELSQCTGNLRKAMQLADKTIAQAREVQHLMGIALGLRYRSMVLVDLGRLPDAEDNAREALRITQEIGDVEDELGALISLVRIRLAKAHYGEAQNELARALSLAESCDVEGYMPLLWSWLSRCQAEQGYLTEAVSSLERANNVVGRAWPHQLCRLHITSARALAAAGKTEEAAERAEQGLQLADASGYRLYALKAHTIIADTTSSQANEAMHRRVAHALARSLSANLSRDDASSFLAQYGIAHPGASE